MSQKELIQQALANRTALVASDLSGGAILNPQQREELADLTIAASQLSQHVTIEKIYDTWDYDSIELTGRYAELDDGTESAGRTPSTYKLNLAPVRLKAVLTLQDSYLQHLATQPIPEEQKAKVIVAAQGTVLANDTENLIYFSNTLGPSITDAAYLNNGTGSSTNRRKDTTLSQFNGLIAAADASGSTIQSYDAAGGSDVQLIARAMLKLLPPAYRQDKSELRYYVPVDFEENLRAYLSKRITQGGDIWLTDDNQIKINGILVAPLPLLVTNPYVVEHVTMNGTTAVALKYKPISASTFYANASTLSSTAAAPYTAGGTDYTLNITAGTVTTPGSGAIGNTAVVKYMYQTLQQIFLTKKTNFIVGIGVNDMSMETQRFANKGATDFVARTRIAYGFLKNSWVVRGYNIADTIVASYGA